MRYPVNIPAKLAPAASGSQVYVFVAGTTNPVPIPLYADGSSGSTLSNPYSHPGGPVNFHLPVPIKVDVGVKPAGAAAPVVTPGVTPTGKAYSYAVAKAAGQPVSWILT